MSELTTEDLVMRVEDMAERATGKRNLPLPPVDLVEAGPNTSDVVRKINHWFPGTHIEPDMPKPRRRRR